MRRVFSTAGLIGSCATPSTIVFHSSSSSTTTTPASSSSSSCLFGPNTTAAKRTQMMIRARRASNIDEDEDDDAASQASSSSSGKIDFTSGSGGASADTLHHPAPIVEGMKELFNKCVRPVTEDYHYRHRLEPIHNLYYQGRHEEVRREVQMLLKIDVTNYLRKHQETGKPLPPVIIFFTVALLGFIRMDNPDSDLTQMAARLMAEVLLHNCRHFDKDFHYTLLAWTLRSEGLSQIVAAAVKEARNITLGEQSPWLTDEFVWHLIGLLDGFYTAREDKRRYVRNEKEHNAQFHLNNRVFLLRRFITGENAIFNREEGGRDICPQALTNLIRSTAAALRAAPQLNPDTEKKGRFGKASKLDTAVKEIVNANDGARHVIPAWAGHEGMLIGCLDAFKATCWSVFQGDTDRHYRVTCCLLLSKWNGPSTFVDRSAITAWGRATFMFRLAARVMQGQNHAYDDLISDPKIVRTLQFAADNLCAELGYNPGSTKRPSSEQELLQITGTHDCSACTLTAPRLRIAYKNLTDTYVYGSHCLQSLQWHNHLACVLVLNAIAATVIPTPDTVEAFTHTLRASVARSVCCAAVALRLYDGLISAYNDVGSCFFLSADGPPPRCVRFLLQAVKQTACVMVGATTRTLFESEHCPSPKNFLYTIESFVAPLLESLFYQCHTDDDALERLMLMTPPTQQDRASETRMYSSVFKLAVDSLGEGEAPRSADLLSLMLRLRKIATGVDVDGEDDISELASQLMPNFNGSGSSFSSSNSASSSYDDEGMADEDEGAYGGGNEQRRQKGNRGEEFGDGFI